MANQAGAYCGFSVTARSRLCQAPAVSRVTLETSKGDVVIEITRAWAPLGAYRFYNLARLGYYDDMRIHRVSGTKWAQFGINGTPAIAQAWRGFCASTAGAPELPPDSDSL